MLDRFIHEIIDFLLIVDAWFGFQLESNRGISKVALFSFMRMFFFWLLLIFPVLPIVDYCCLLNSGLIPLKVGKEPRADKAPGYHWHHQAQQVVFAGVAEQLVDCKSMYAIMYYRRWTEMRLRLLLGWVWLVYSNPSDLVWTSSCYEPCPHTL